MNGRHYVTVGKGVRPYLVMRTVAVPTGRKRRIQALRYVQVSKHFTWKRAAKVSQRLNAREGHSS